MTKISFLYILPIVKKLIFCRTQNFMGIIKNTTTFKLKSIFFSIIFLVGIGLNAFGQSVALTSYTVESTNATCTSNGVITIKVPQLSGGSTYSGTWTAQITRSGSNPVAQNVPTTGGDVVFNSLLPGDYNVLLTDGTNTLAYSNNPIKINTSYVTMTLSATSVPPTCTTGTNGSLTVNVGNGTGVGPFKYTVTTSSGSQSQTITSRSITFSNIPSGVATIIVEDLVNNQAGCSTSSTFLHTVANTSTSDIIYFDRPYTFQRDCSAIPGSCSGVKVHVNLRNVTLSRLTVLQSAGNATISIGGNTYPLTFLKFDGPAAMFVYDAAVTGGPVPQNGDVITSTFNDGCTTISRTATVVMKNDFLTLGSTVTMDPQTCQKTFKISLLGDEDVNGNRAVYFCQNNTVSFERKDANGIFQPVPNSEIIPDPSLGNNDIGVLLGVRIPSASNSYTVQPGWYRVTVSDGCNTVVRERIVSDVNPMNNITVQEISSVISGTSAIKVNFISQPPLNTPKIKITRKDGQTNITHTASQPGSLATTYNYTFPMEVVYSTYPAPEVHIGDLPLGEYVVEVSDACTSSSGYTKTLEINLTKAASYNPVISVVQGCNNSNSVQFNLNPVNVLNSTQSIQLVNRTTGAVVGSFGGAASTLSNTFNNVPSGDYSIRFLNIRYLEQSAPNYTYSAAFNQFGYLQYTIPITIEASRDFTVDTSVAFCAIGDPSSGIVSAQITDGSIFYPVTFTLFQTSNASTPFQPAITISSGQPNAVFQNVPQGSYFVRVATACSSKDVAVNVTTTTTVPQARVSDSAVCPGSPTTLAAISATNNLYDIAWEIKNSNGTFSPALGSNGVQLKGMPVALTPAFTTTYRAVFSLKSTFGCSNNTTYYSEVEVKVTPNPDEDTPKVTDIDLCKNPNPTVTISDSELGFTYEILNPQGLSFSPKITGVGTGGNLVLSIPANQLIANTKLKVSSTNGNAGCTGFLIDEIDVTQSSANLLLDVDGSSVCANTDGTIVVKAAENGVTYTILKNGAVLSLSITKTGAGADLSFTIPKTELSASTNEFSIQASGAGCATGVLSEKAIITVQQAPTTSSSIDAICGVNDGKGTINVSTFGGSGTYEYSLDHTTWQDGNSFSVNPGTYTVYSRDKSNGCTSSSTVVIGLYCLELTKTSTTNPNNFDAVGDVLTYNIIVKNTGNLPLNSIQVVDPQANLNSSSISSLAAGASATLSASYTVKQEDLDRGYFINSASARAVYNNTDIQDGDDETINAVQDSKLEVKKTADKQIYAVGDLITYTFEVKNTGNVTLSDLSITDQLAGLSAVSPTSIASLAPGATTIFTATYTATQADVDAGSVVNTAIAKAKFGATDVTDTDTDTISAASQSSSLSLTKTTDKQTYNVGDVITYTFEVKNTGKVTLSNITIIDPMVGLSAISPTSVTSLAPNATATFTATYTATQADVDSGTIENTATSKGKFGAADVTDAATETITSTKNPSLSITKTTSSNSFDEVGQVLSYTINIKNNGNVSLSNIDVEDPLTGFKSSIATLAPNESKDFTTTYTIQYTDLGKSEIKNIASAKFRYGTNDFEFSDDVIIPNSFVLEDLKCDANNYAIGTGVEIDLQVEIPYSGGTAASYPAGQAIDLGNGTLTATLQAGTINPQGGVLIYRVVGKAENANPVVLPVYFGGQSCELTIYIYEPSLVEPFLQVYPFNDKNRNCIKDGESTENIPTSGFFLKVYDLDNNFIKAEKIDETIQVFFASLSINSDAIYYYIIDDNDDPTDLNPGLPKGWNSSEMGTPNLKRYFYYDTSVGDFWYNNTAQLNLVDPSWYYESLRVCMYQEEGEIDSLDCVNAVFTNPIVINQDAEGNNFTVNYTGGNGGYYDALELVSKGISGITANLVSGSFADGAGTLTFSLSGKPTSGGSGKFELTIGGPSCEVMFFVEEAKLSITKEALDLTFANVGDELKFKIAITNNGNVALSNVLVRDPLTGLEETIIKLSSGETKTFSTKYTVRQSDIVAGKIENTALADFKFRGVNYEEKASANSNLDQSGKKISVNVEAVDYTFDYSGDKLKVLYSVKNEGNVTLFNVLVKDETTGFEKTLDKLEPGEEVVFPEIIYAVVDEDFELGYKDYEVIAEAYTLDNTKIEDVDFDEILKRIIQTIDVKVTANTNIINKVGQVIVYTYEVINTGNVDIGKVIVKDPKTGLDVVLDELLYKEVKILTKEYVVSQEDLDRGYIKNIVTAEIEILVNSLVDGSKAEDDELVNAEQKAELSIVKDSEESGYRLVGEKINYTITVTNSGNVSLENISVKDPLTGMLENISSLAPRESKTFNTSYTIVKNDRATGFVNNTATAEFIYGGSGYTVDASKKVEYLGFLSTIEAKDDDYKSKPLNILESGLVGNVLANDLMDSEAVKAADVSISITDNGGISGLAIDKDGKLTIPSDTPAGSYTIKYSICDLKDLDNCSEAKVTFQVIRGVNLRIFKELVSEVEAEGDSFDYILRVENNGTTTATNVVVTDLIPLGLTYVSSSIKDATAETTVFGDELKWTIASLEAGKSFVITLRVKSLPLLNGKEKSITNTAKVASADTELSPADNSSSVSVLIEPFFIPNMITPNGDGYNDQFVIKGLTRFLNTELVILNRWGDHVYKSSNYKNDWSARGLVAGSYFYVLTGVDKQGKRHDFKGWIQLIVE